MLQFLLEEKVDFILVGAYALAAHGYPRATGDIDIWVKADENNSLKVYQALRKFGAPVQQIKTDDFAIEGVIFQIGVAPRRIDIITQVTGVTYEEADKDKIIVEIEGLRIPIISLNNLIKNKNATGREKDRLDAQLLIKRNSPSKNS